MPTQITAPPLNFSDTKLEIAEGFKWTIYCDGACLGNPGPGGIGCLLLHAASPKAPLVMCGAKELATNNQMELSAAIAALSEPTLSGKVLIRTDSQYVIKGCTEWRAGWTRNGMKNSKKETVANSDLWLRLWTLVDKHRAQFQWVKGHNGDPGNELADMLASFGAEFAQQKRSKK